MKINTGLVSTYFNWTSSAWMGPRASAILEKKDREERLSTDSHSLPCLLFLFDMPKKLWHCGITEIPDQWKILLSTLLQKKAEKHAREKKKTLSENLTRLARNLFERRRNGPNVSRPINSYVRCVVSWRVIWSFIQSKSSKYLLLFHNLAVQKATSKTRCPIRIGIFRFRTQTDSFFPHTCSSWY